VARLDLPGMITRRTWLKWTCLLTLAVSGVLIPFVLVLMTNGYDDLDDGNSPFKARIQGFEGKLSPHERKPLDYPEGVEETREDLQYQVQEMQQIVVSVRNELRELTKEREEVREAVDRSKSTLARVRKEVGNAKSSLQESKEKLAKVLREMKRANHDEGAQVTKSPVVVVNLPIEQGSQRDRGMSPEGGVASRGVAKKDCFDGTCFDYSRCSLTSTFLVYVNNQHYPDTFRLRYPGAVSKLVSSLQLTDSLTSDPNTACVFVSVTEGEEEEEGRKAFHQKLQSLPHWRDGSNHVVVDLSYTSEQPSSAALNYEPSSTSSRAIEARTLSTGSERWGHDILLPPVTREGSEGKPLWKNAPPLSPALRQVLMHFEGVPGDSDVASSQHGIGVRQLKIVSDAITSNTKDRVVLAANCSAARKPPLTEGGGRRHSGNHLGEWELCGTPQDRSQSLSRATFSLVIVSRTGSVGPVTYTRLIEGLRYGAIPVVLGVQRLPFDDVIDWERAAVILPVSSLGELHYVLRSMDGDTILRYRIQGRFLWDTYFSSPLSILETVVAIVRQRSKHHPPPANAYVPANLVTLPGENRVITSQEFMYNFSSYTTDLWNTPPGPFFMFPTTPFKPVPVSGSQYTNLNAKQISSLPPHVVAGGGITGPFFEDYLLGNTPEEQFTVVILTYKRNEVLLDALHRLKDLDHLAKAVVVWNNPEPPPAAMKWPDIGVPIDVSWTLS
jgi:alpha-1,4-N-acetylglucosaminyltransferase EXTL3